MYTLVSGERWKFSTDLFFFSNVSGQVNQEWNKETSTYMYNTHKISKTGKLVFTP
jgi:hypothetical protein